jgi:hypothetical protein
VVVVVLQRVCADEPFHEDVIEKDEEPEGGHAADRAPELVAEVALHELHLLELDRVAFRRDGDTLAPGGPLRRGGEDLLPPTLGDAIPVEDRGGDEAVHDEVRVTADRRGEMRVVPRGEGEVGLRLGRVSRLLHAAEDERVHERLLGASAHVLEQLLERLGGALGALAERQVEGAQELAEALDLGRVGRLVDAVDRGDAPAVQLLGDRHVGEEHELLDEAVRVEAKDALDVGGLAGGVEDDARLGEIEVEASALAPAGAELPAQVAQGAKRIPDVGGGSISALEDLVGLLVVEVVAAPDHGAGEAVTEDAGLGIEVEEEAEREAVGVGLEGAEVA